MHDTFACIVCAMVWYIHMCDTCERVANMRIALGRKRGTDNLVVSLQFINFPACDFGRE